MLRCFCWLALLAVGVSQPTSHFPLPSPLPRFWGTIPIPDRWLLHNEAWIFNASGPLVKSLPFWRWQYNRTIPFADSVSMVRIMGGWTNKLPNGTQTPNLDGEFVTRSSDGGLEYNWTRIDERVDPFVNIGLNPSPIVLDNVPWALAKNVSNLCSYGYCGPPANVTEFGIVVQALVTHLVDRYGSETVARWRFRVGTEANGPRLGDPFPAGLDEYIAIYDHAALAVKTASPHSGVGPCNFAGLGDPTLSAATAAVFQFFEHCHNGTNAATGGVGSPADWVAESAYSSSGAGADRDAWSAAAMGRKADVMASLARKLGRDRVPLEVMEFGWGSWEDDVSVDASKQQPGVYGAAWMVASWVYQLRARTSRVFHWGYYFDNGLDPKNEDMTLVTGQGVVMALAELLVGGSDASASLTTWPSQTNPSANDTLAVISSAQPNGIGGQGDAGEAVLTAFYADMDLASPRRTVNVTVARPAMHIHTRPTVTQYKLTMSSSVLDLIHRDLYEAEAQTGDALLNPGYNLSATCCVDELRTMATPTGLARVKASAHRYVTLSKAALTERPFDGNITSDTPQGIVLEFQVEAPEVRLLLIRWSQVQQTRTMN